MFPQLWHIRGPHVCPPRTLPPPRLSRRSRNCCADGSRRASHTLEFTLALFHGPSCRGGPHAIIYPDPWPPRPHHRVGCHIDKARPSVPSSAYPLRRCSSPRCHIQFLQALRAIVQRHMPSSILIGIGQLPANAPEVEPAGARTPAVAGCGTLLLPALRPTPPPSTHVRALQTRGPSV